MAVLHSSLTGNHLHFPLGHSTAGDLVLVDNLSEALHVEEANNRTVLTYDTLTGAHAFYLGNSTDAPTTRWRGTDWIFEGVDNQSSMYVIREGTSGPAYVQIDSTNAQPFIQFGNATNNPEIRVQGSGAWYIGGGYGTSGHVLTSNGSGAAPTWQAAAGGGNTLDQAYDQGGAGSGRTIEATNGPVYIWDATAGRTGYLLEVEAGAQDFTGTPHGLLVDFNNATSFSNAADIYGLRMLGKTNGGAGDTVGLSIDTNWDYGIECDSIVGGSASGGDITIESTKHATKGTVFFPDGDVRFNSDATSTETNPEIRFLDGNATNVQTHIITTEVHPIDAADQLLVVRSLQGGAIVSGQRYGFAVGDPNDTTSTESWLYQFCGSGSAVRSSYLRLDAGGALNVWATTRIDMETDTRFVQDLSAIGPLIDLDPTGAFTLDMDAGQTATITVSDNQASAFKVQEATNSYIDLDTTNAAESLALGYSCVHTVDLGNTLESFTSDDSEPDNKMYRKTGSTNTTDATPKTCLSITTTSNAGGWCSVRLIANKDGEVNAYFLNGKWHNNAGTVTLTTNPGTADWEDEDTAAWSATLAVSGADINLDVTGAASTNIDWAATIEWQEARN